jgi:hypothetical protein
MECLEFVTGNKPRELGRQKAAPEPKAKKSKEAHPI